MLDLVTKESLNIGIKPSSLLRFLLLLRFVFTQHLTRTFNVHKCLNNICTSE